MPLNNSLIAIGTLFTLGAAGGFALSTQVSPAAVDSVMQHPADAGGEGQGGGVPGKKSQRAGPTQKRSDGGSSASEGGGGGRGREKAERPGTERDEAEEAAGAGSGKPAANTERKTASQGDRADGRGSTRDGSTRDAPSSAEATGEAAMDDPVDGGTSSPCRSAEITGVEAAAFLSGNTASDVADDGTVPEITYFAPRGWIARFRSDVMFVKAWNTSAATLCDPDPRATSSTVCEVIHARKCLDIDQNRFHIGDVRTQSGRWIRVLKGNLQDFPGYIPYFDPQPVAPPEVRKIKGIEGRRPRDQDRFLGGATYRYARQGDPDRDRIVYLDDSGRLLDFPVPTSDEIANGVTIESGRWERRRGDICGASFSADARPTCWALSHGKGGRLLLRSRSTPVSVALVAIRDVKPVATTDDVRLALLPGLKEAGLPSEADRRPATVSK